jgi:cell wall assembly regulator SMI1
MQESIAGVELVNDRGKEETLELLPPATAEEISTLEATLPAPLPVEIREALEFSKGFANGPLESLSLSELGRFGLEDVFPHAHPIGHDGLGNYWVMDLLPEQTTWGPVFFACHDPPVIAYQSDTISDFVREIVALWQPGPRSSVDVVCEDVTMNIWRSNSGILDHATAQDSDDPVLAGFADGFPPEAAFADLRAGKVGDGFSWGRFGPRDEWTRCGTERLWAIVPPQRPGLLARIFGRGGSS